MGQIYFKMAFFVLCPTEATDFRFYDYKVFKELYSLIPRDLPRNISIPKTSKNKLQTLLRFKPKRSWFCHCTFKEALFFFFVEVAKLVEVSIRSSRELFDVSIADQS